MHSAAGWFYSDFRVCLFVRLSQSGEAWERVSGVTAGTHGWLVCSSPRCKRKPSDSGTIDGRGTALLAQAQYRERAPEAPVRRRTTCLYYTIAYRVEGLARLDFSCFHVRLVL